MASILKKVELLANVAIIVVALLLASVLVKNYLWQSNSLQSNQKAAAIPQQRIEVGSKINLPDIDWRKNQQTLLLVLSTTCHFCSESASFYQQLVKERDVNTRIIAILPQPISEGKDYLNRLGVTVDDIKQTSLSSVGIRGTPTLILVDSNGTVKASWMGKLPNTEEAEVINRVRQSIAQR
jgi:thioredoxin-related protein